MVPKGWEVQQLADLTTKISDGIHSTPKYVEKSNIYFINGNNLKNGSVVISDSTKEVCTEDAQNHRRDLTNRTILMSINGTIGNLAFYNNENVVLGKSACYINVADNVDIKYIYYTLDSSKTQNFYTTELTGSTIKNLSLKTIKLTKILTPPFTEQQKIAKVLTTWDNAISTTERLIDNSTQQKKALMQQLLTGKKRLLDESGKRFEGEWKKYSLREIVSITYGKSPKEIFCDTGKYDVIGTGGITGRTNDVLCDETAVVLGRKGTIDKPQLITSPFWAIDTTFYCCPKNEEIDIIWFFYLSKILNLRSYNEASGVPSLSRETLYGISVRVPKHIEQQKIATVLTNADKEIELLEQQLADLQQEKKALMQVLLTGKKRVVVDGEV